MVNEIINTAIHAAQQNRAPVRLPGSTRSGNVNDPQQSLPATGEKLPPAKAETAVTRENLDKAVKQLNEYVQSLSRDLQFSIDEDSGETIVKVIDSQTKEVIRQFPSEEALRRAKALSEGQSLLIRAEA